MSPRPPGGRAHRAWAGIPPAPPPLTEMPTHPVSLLDSSHADSEVLSPVRASGESLGVRMVLRTPKTGPDLSSRVHSLHGTFTTPLRSTFELSSEGGNALALEIRTLKLREGMGFGQGCRASKGRDGGVNLCMCLAPQSH